MPLACQSEPVFELINKLSDEGLSAREIARATGYSQRTIMDRLNGRVRRWRWSNRSYDEVMEHFEEWAKERRDLIDRIFSLLVQHTHSLKQISKDLGLPYQTTLNLMKFLEKKGKVWRSESSRPRYFASSSWIVQRALQEVGVE